ncbi:MAG: VWA domain-containing protein [Acidobacteriota bacterium]|nr:VWA domain-containing protein [Acidobacteriota bacterium]
MPGKSTLGLLLLLWLSTAAMVIGADNSRLEVVFKPLEADLVSCRIGWELPKELLQTGTPFDADNPLRLEGEVAGREASSFRFHFFPNLAEDTIWLRFERYMQPGETPLALKLFQGERLLTQTGKRLAVPNLPEGKASHEIFIRLTEEQALYQGKSYFEVDTRGSDIAAVRYVLDGVEVGRAVKPPYRSRLKLGRPRVMKLSAEALADDGSVLARDTVQLNAGPYAFDVRLVEPMPDKPYRDAVRARARVRPPLGLNVKSVDFMLEDQPVATLFSEPYSLIMEIPDGMVNLRVVGHVDRRTVAEDTVLLNPPPGLQRLEVRNIDLYITVEDKDGDYLEFLEQKDFQVFENDEPVAIQEFMPGEDRSLHMAFLVDISGSMADYIPNLVDGGRDVVEKLLGPGDRVSLSLFSQKQALLTSFTSSKYRFFSGLNELEREANQPGNTAFYDGIITALYDLSGIEGRRALLIFSDGMDNASRFSRKDVMTFARQAGVRFYIFHTLPAGMRGRDAWLSRLAEETGGGYYNINNPVALELFYEKITKDLSSQYLIRYQAGREPGDQECRQIRVEVSEKNAKVRTMTGYCP